MVSARLAAACDRVRSSRTRATGTGLALSTSITISPVGVTWDRTIGGAGRRSRGAMSAWRCVCGPLGSSGHGDSIPVSVMVVTRNRWMSVDPLGSTAS
jgi:hypothetical protein